MIYTRERSKIHSCPETKPILCNFCDQEYQWRMSKRMIVEKFKVVDKDQKWNHQKFVVRWLIDITHVILVINYETGSNSQKYCFWSCNLPPSFNWWMIKMQLFCEMIISFLLEPKTLLFNQSWIINQKLQILLLEWLNGFVLCYRFK